MMDYYYQLEDEVMALDSSIDNEDGCIAIGVSYAAFGEECDDYEGEIDQLYIGRSIEF